MKNYITYKTKEAKEFFLQKISFTISPYELKEWIKNKIDEINILDVRRYDDYIESHIPYAVHIPYDSIENHLNMLNKEKINVIYCYDIYCKLASKAACIFADKGYPVMEMCGGFHIWKKLNFETVSNVTND